MSALKKKTLDFKYMKVVITKRGHAYGVGFNQGNQYFLLDYTGTKKEAREYAKSLKLAFKSYEEEICDKEMVI